MSKGTTICVYNEKLGMFKVLKTKGKSISSGGYGVPHTTTSPTTTTTKTLVVVDDEANASPMENGHETTGCCNMKNQLQKNVTHIYLFIEEALFLHERGMLAVYHSQQNYRDNQNQQKDSTHEHIISASTITNTSTNVDSTSADNARKLMSTQDLYEIMLHTLNMPLAIYLSYSHLRAQTFIVIRHTKKRLELISKRKIEEQEREHASEKKHNHIGDKKRKVKSIDSGLDSYEDGKGSLSRQSHTQQQQLDKGKDHTCTQDKQNAGPNKDGDNDNKNNFMTTKKEIRDDAFHAPQPQLFRDAASHDSDSGQEIYASMSSSASIAYDVYYPNSNYRKTMPDLPDFYVAVVPYAEPSPTFSSMKAIILACEGIPIKISTVSDGGTVNMFGITDLKVPSISEKE